MENNNNNQNPILNDILEVVTFIKDNAVTKDEAVTKQEFEEHIGGLEKRVDKIEALMVTKDYLDHKLADLGAEIGARINRKVEREQTFKRLLIDSLKNHSILDSLEISKLEELI